MHESLMKARELVADVTPLKTDCGRVCGARCCQSMEEEETGMLLFPGEEEAYRGKDGWMLRETKAGILAVCSGRCSRQERPLACRVFPLLPVLRDGTVKIAADQRAKTICPLVRQGVRGMDPAFKDVVREAGKILAEDPEQRAFLEMLTAEQDELRALRERLCGAAGSGSGLL